MDETPVLLSVDPLARDALASISQRAHCSCLAARTRKGTPGVPNLHIEQQVDTTGWRTVVELMHSANSAGTRELEPAAHLPWKDWMTVITLPTEIGRCTQIETLALYGSHLRRLPPEIGRLASLQDLDLYTSYSLHWLPYEVTRCKDLARTRMSTRALYGNRKTRLPFPRLHRPVETLIPPTCSICDRGFGERGPNPLWTTARVGTDYVGLLAHSCSRECTLSIPAAPPGFHAAPHKGGGGVGMPD